MDGCIQTEQILVRENPDKLVTLEAHADGIARRVIEALRLDCVVLIRNVSPEEADATLHTVADQLGLLGSLEQQAAYAGFVGHRRRIGKYGMTVNTRDAYQFIPPHSEGNSQTKFQLASFYCFENTTNGGETILLSVDGTSALWDTLREETTRIRRESRQLTAGEMRRATALYRLGSPPHIADGDRIVGELPSAIPGLLLATVLAVSRKVHSKILEQDLHVYWDSVASIDTSSGDAYVRLLREAGLLKEPNYPVDVQKLDNATPRRIWSSGVDHNALFRCKLTHKLASRDLIILNNCSWAHSVSNWSPESGVRNVSAAFA
jgi:hypothetical protein